jgi:hypothetical protein
MDASSPRDFFLTPSSPGQRQYEALRCVFVDGRSQKEAAERFGYSYGAFRQLVLQFRNQLGEEELPPFFTSRPRAGRHGRPRNRPHLSNRSTRPSPTPAT